jgi:hypothetical protein
LAVGSSCCLGDGKEREVMEYLHGDHGSVIPHIDEVRQGRER